MAMGEDIMAEKLPKNVAVLTQMLLDSHMLVENLQKRFDKETGILLEQIRLLRQQLYGRKSEKMPVDGSPQLLRLFDLPEPASIEPEAQTTEIPTHTHKKSGRKPLPEHLPRVEVIHDIPQEEKICGSGHEMPCIGEEVLEQLDVVPARIQVIRNIRPKYACRHCEGVVADGPAVKIAPAVPQVIPKSIASPSLLAYVLTGKFVDAVPFYRQEKQFFRLGIDLSRTSMSTWSIKAASMCQPLLNLFQDEILAGIYLHIDKTTIQVLQEPGRDPTSISYMWIFRSGDLEKPVLVYQYHPTRAGSADVALDYIRRRHKIEDTVKGVPPETIYQLRQEKALNQWGRLVGYLADGRLTPDNSAAKNAFRPFVVGRNWLLGGTLKGAAASALFYSLIETAKANGLKPRAYLRFIFEKLPTATRLEDYEALLPWNVEQNLLALLPAMEAV